MENSLAAVSEWGPLGTLKRLHPAYLAHRLKLALLERSEGFDLKFGVETRVKRRTSLYSDKDLAKTDAIMYWPSPARLAREMITSIAEDFREFSFVDVGCGKGRVLILSNELGFERILGIEAEPTVHEICRRNICAAGINNIHLVLGNAAQFEYDQGRYMFYLFRPFGVDTLRAFLANLRALERDGYSEYYILFLDPEEEHIDAIKQSCGAILTLSSNKGASQDSSGIYDWYIFHYQNHCEGQ